MPTLIILVVGLALMALCVNFEHRLQSFRQYGKLPARVRDRSVNWDILVNLVEIGLTLLSGLAVGYGFFQMISGIPSLREELVGSLLLILGGVGLYFWHYIIQEEPYDLVPKEYDSSGNVWLRFGETHSGCLTMLVFFLFLLPGSISLFHGIYRIVTGN